MTVEKNNKVTIEYEGRFDNNKGQIFDASEGKQPLVFITGMNMVVPGFDEAIIGMEKEQEKEIILKPEQAYGNYREELKQKIPREVLPKEQTPEPGMMLLMSTPQGQRIPAKITEVNDKEVTLDINHPLAGKTLYFKIKLKDYEEFNPEELKKLYQEQYGSCECNCNEDSHECKCEDTKCACEDDNCKCESEKSKTSIEDLAD